MCSYRNIRTRNQLSLILMQVVYDKVKAFLSTRSLTYRDGPISFVASEEPFLALHVEELRICDTDFDASVPYGMRLMSWQVPRLLLFRSASCSQIVSRSHYVCTLGKMDIAVL